jgi:hypothetical protein
MHRLTRLFLALMTIVALSGVASAAVSTEIEFWVTFGGAKGEVLREVLGDFAAKNPGLSVRLVTGSGGEKLMTAIAAGSPPDVADMHGGEYSVLGMKGLLRPLDPLLKAHGGFQVKDLARGYERLGMYAGTRYTLPFWDIAPSYSLVYDAEAFDEAGVIRPARDRAPSWAEIGAFSKKLTLMDADGRLTRVGLHPKETWHTVSYTWESLFDVVLYQDGYRPRSRRQPYFGFCVNHDEGALCGSFPWHPPIQSISQLRQNDDDHPRISSGRRNPSEAAGQGSRRHLGAAYQRQAHPALACLEHRYSDGQQEACGGHTPDQLPP